MVTFMDNYNIFTDNIGAFTIYYYMQGKTRFTVNSQSRNWSWSVLEDRTTPCQYSPVDSIAAMLTSVFVWNILLATSDFTSWLSVAVHTLREDLLRVTKLFLIHLKRIENQFVQLCMHTRKLINLKKCAIKHGWLNYIMLIVVQGSTIIINIGNSIKDD